MSIGINKVILLGHVGNDPEIRQVNSTLLMKLRLATSSYYRDRNEQYQERTEWHNVAIWGKRAEQLSPLIKRGDQLMVEGELRTSSFDKDGAKRYFTDIRAQDVKLLSPRSRDKDTTAAEPARRATPPPLPVMRPNNTTQLPPS